VAKSIALVVIYNHRYDNNINIINALYKDKFSDIYHLMPFYDGDIENVIPVFQNSHYFQGYINQAYPVMRDSRFSHYVFIADDLILNPKINENNILHELKLDYGTSFITGMGALHKDEFWPHKIKALDFIVNSEGSEGLKYLPSYEEAAKKMSAHNLRALSFTGNQLFKRPLVKGFSVADLIGLFNYQLQKNKQYTLPYPLVGGYSDFIVVPSEYMNLFSYYCGIFASMRTFVELAIPTALVFSSKNIRTIREINYFALPMWSHGELLEFESKYSCNIMRLLSGFPDDVLYFHPVKLSKWSNYI